MGVMCLRICGASSCNSRLPIVDRGMATPSGDGWADGPWAGEPILDPHPPLTHTSPAPTSLLSPSSPPSIATKAD